MDNFLGGGGERGELLCGRPPSIFWKGGMQPHLPESVTAML